MRDSSVCARRIAATGTRGRGPVLARFARSNAAVCPLFIFYAPDTFSVTDGFEESKKKSELDRVASGVGPGRDSLTSYWHRRPIGSVCRQRRS